MMEHIVLLVVFGAAETLEQCYSSGNPSWERLSSIQLSDMSPRSSRVKRLANETVSACSGSASSRKIRPREPKTYKRMRLRKQSVYSVLRKNQRANAVAVRRQVNSPDFVQRGVGEKHMYAKP